MFPSRLLPTALATLLLVGCGRPGTADAVWGRRGVMNGDLMRPRAISIGPDDRLYLVDYTARIQVFDLDGKYLGPTWTTPDFRNGRPSGLGIDIAGRLVVCDSHYGCVRVYDRDGNQVKLLGGDRGTEPGQFGYVSDAIQTPNGHWYLSEFNQNERITELDGDGHLIRCWGDKGTGPGEFNHLRALVLGPDGNLYAADACNHRVQVFTQDGTFVREFGTPGSAPGQMSYPYDLAFGPLGELYVVEYDNHRVQKFTADGRYLAGWGSPGRGPGQLHNPWAVAVDRFGRVHVVDTENHRIQRVRF